ncbi:MAG: WbuC family cupin fold metalloprotein [Bacteroidales bacterium]|nr:WbuC family cupin fold metalloprotein [Bacteroidales bacterium]
MVLDKSFLDTLSIRASASPRLRQHYDLRDSSEDECQRMLNAIEPGTVIPVHRHSMTSEDVVILRGRAEEVFFDESGVETARFLLIPGGAEPDSAPVIHVPIGQYHTCRSLQSGTVIIEFKNTKYDPAKTEELL